MVQLPYWFADDLSAYNEVGRIIDTMWKEYKKSFDTTLIGPHNYKIIIHDQIGSWQHESGTDLRGLAYPRQKLIIVAWNCPWITQTLRRKSGKIFGSITFRDRSKLDLLTNLEVLYHEWAHCSYEDPDSKHSSDRWLLVNALTPVPWTSSVHPKQKEKAATKIPRGVPK